MIDDGDDDDDDDDDDDEDKLFLQNCLRICHTSLTDASQAGVKSVQNLSSEFVDSLKCRIPQNGQTHSNKSSATAG